VAGMRTLALAFTGLAATLVTGCASQISALAPVSGDNTFMVRTATIDVLLREGYQLRIVPTCNQQAQAVVCEGTTMQDEQVTVQAPGKGATTMTVTVGGAVIYDGSVREIIDAAAGES